MIGKDHTKVSYRAAAHDVQHFSTWVKEITADEPVKELSLEECSAQFKRYGALAEELKSQVEVHSSRLGVVLGKLWAGTTRLLVQLFSLNGRLNAEKDQLQQDLDAQKALGVETKNAFLVELDQMKLQLTVARAALRDKDTEVLNLSRSNRHMESELLRLRRVIGTYIEGHPEDVDEADDLGGGVAMRGGDAISLSSGGGADEPYIPAAIDTLGTRRQRDVFELDDEVDAMFAMVAHENQRQRKFADDMDRMMDSLHRSKGGSLGARLASEDGMHNNNAPADGQPRAEMGDSQAQTKDSEFEMLALGIEFGMGSLRSRAGGGGGGGGGGGPDDVRDGMDAAGGGRGGRAKGGGKDGGRPGSRGKGKGSAPTHPPPNVVERDPSKSEGGMHMPAALRTQMGSFPRTLRIPSLLSTLKFTLKMFLDKMKYDEVCDANQQARLSVPEFVYFFYCKKYGLEKLADLHTTQLQLAMLHHRQHKRINLLAMFLGAYEVDNPPSLTLRDTNFLFLVLANLRKYEAFNEKILQDRDAQIDIGRNIAVAAVRTVFAPILPDAGVNIMNRITTLPAPTESKNPKAVDLDHLLELCVDRWIGVNEMWRNHLAALFELHCSFFEVVTEMSFALDTHPGTVGRDAKLLALERPKKSNDLMVGANNYRSNRNLEIAMKMKDPFVSKEGGDIGRDGRKRRGGGGGGEGGNREGSKLQEVLRLGHRTRGDDDSSVGGGSLDGAGSLWSGKGSYAGDGDESVTTQELGGGIARKAGTTDEMVALITKDGFKSLMNQVKPGCSEAEIVTLWEKGLERSHQKCMDRFQQLWRRYETSEGLPFWHNRWKNSTQWTPPYEPANFLPEDFEQDSLVEICLEARLLESSPFVSLLDKNPRDLWSESDIFLHELQQEEEEKRARQEKRDAEEAAKKQAEATSRAKAGSARRGIQKVQIPEVSRRT